MTSTINFSTTRSISLHPGFGENPGIDFPAESCHNDGMSDETISHNREDYPPRIQMMISAMSKVFWNGDLDVAWEDFFESSERHRADFENATSCYDTPSAKVEAMLKSGYHRDSRGITDSHS